MNRHPPRDQYSSGDAGYFACETIGITRKDVAPAKMIIIAYRTAASEIPSVTHVSLYLAFADTPWA
jgi:hypothetical protein